MSKKIKRMKIADFRADGYLQELNRRFLHPLGLALEVVVDSTGHEHIGGVWDYRDDPEGINYLEIDLKKTEKVDRRWKKREPARVEGLGYMVQPPCSDK